MRVPGQLHAFRNHGAADGDDGARHVVGSEIDTIGEVEVVFLDTIERHDGRLSIRTQLTTVRHSAQGARFQPALPHRSNIYDGTLIVDQT
jgi:hypothetical protein